MALLYPDINIIKSMKPVAEKGELHLLSFLSEVLDDSYEIYFQPYLNGDRPDIVVLRKDSGLLIIEVKDWSLSNYQVDQKGKWSLLDGTIIKSPFAQVQRYKENLFELHIDDLLSRQIRNPNMFSTVSCAVYFHNADEMCINSLILPAECDEKYKKWLSYFVIMGNNSLTVNNIKTILNKKFLDRKSKYFDFELYNKIKRFLLPPRHLSEQGKEIRYTNEQKSLIISRKGDQKIKGVAGCGKTLVLAKRAVNSLIRTNSKVLIITFNITLRNYIHDKLSEVRENFEWNNFVMLHFHEFFTSMANNHNLVMDLTSFEDINFFESVKTKLFKYSAIFIDEGQDHKYEWLVILKKYFLKENGEFVIFADEKQNIYKRELDNNKKTKTNILGRWNEQLKSTWRLSKTIIQLANDYQKEYWKNKYTFDDIKFDPSQKDLFDNDNVEYIYFENGANSEEIIKYIYGKIKNKNIHPNDIGILGPEIELMRNIGFKIRNIEKEKTKTMFETQEIYDFLLHSYIKAKLEGKELLSRLHDELNKIRKSKKFNFWMNPGTIKISTIHSFKGWEIDTLFLLIPNKLEEINISLDELIYTGITRAKRNLFLINLGNTNSHVFFEKEINLLKEEKSLETLTQKV